MTPVVLIHGLGRSSSSLSKLARKLEARRHPVLNVDYNSRRHDLRECARRIEPEIIAFENRFGRNIVLIGHSMGGLVARILAAEANLNVCGIVMLAPPNGGSEVADWVHRSRVGRLLLGPALGDLRTVAASKVPCPSCPIGVIAGSRSYLPFTSRLIAGQNDGLVSLERTRLDGADWISVPAGHTFLMNHPAVVDAVIGFARDRCFPQHLRCSLPPLAPVCRL
jgi:predicted alpha/beta hydrolase family esterase